MGRARPFFFFSSGDRRLLLEGFNRSCVFFRLEKKTLRVVRATGSRRRCAGRQRSPPSGIAFAPWGCPAWSGGRRAGSRSARAARGCAGRFVPLRGGEGPRRSGFADPRRGGGGAARANTTRRARARADPGNSRRTPRVHAPFAHVGRSAPPEPSGRARGEGARGTPRRRSGWRRGERPRLAVAF